jgi:hypothetical protein
MAKPRMARSARIAERDLDMAQIPNSLKKHRLRLTAPTIDEVKLNKGAHVEVTVAAKNVTRHS